MSFHPGRDAGEKKKLRELSKTTGLAPGQNKLARQLLDLEAQRTSHIDNDEDDDSDDDSEDTDAIEEELTQVETALSQFNTQLARTHIDTAIALAKNGITRSHCLDLYAQILMEETAHPDEVIKILREAEMLTPHTNHERLVSLAQFYQDKKAVSLYRDALNIVENELKTLNNMPTTAQTSEILSRITELKCIASSIFVSIYELYTTDLCDENDAEMQAENSITQATQLDPHNPDAFRCLGSLRIIQGRKKDAKIATLKACEVLRYCIDNQLDVPPFVARMDLGLQLLELECYEDSTALLVGLLQEEQLIAEVWHYAVISTIKYASTFPYGPNKTLSSEATDLLSCASQYAVHCLRLLKQAPDNEMSSELSIYIKQLETLGFSLKQAEIDINNAQYANDDADTLANIESDDDMND